MNEVTFGVMTDLHTDIVHDGRRRLGAFLQACADASVDFAIQLGDFIHPHGRGLAVCPENKISVGMRNILAGRGLPNSEKDSLLTLYKGAGFPTFHVIGNHDTDLYTKREIMDYWGMQRNYYSFDACGYHFVVLDANFGLSDGELIDFGQGNYMNWCFMPDEPFPLIPAEQLEWLRCDLADTDAPTVVFSHEGLCPGFLNIHNADEVFDILCARQGQVILHVYGHKHQDLFETYRGIPCYGLNSMSGYSVPPQFGATRFDRDTEEAYPNLRNMCVYVDPLFAVVRISEDGISIKGRQSSFVPPTPDEVGVHFAEPSIRLTPVASDVTIAYNSVREQGNSKG